MNGTIYTMTRNYSKRGELTRIVWESSNKWLVSIPKDNEGDIRPGDMVRVSKVNKE